MLYITYGGLNVSRQKANLSAEPHDANRLTFWLSALAVQVNRTTTLGATQLSTATSLTVARGKAVSTAAVKAPMPPLHLPYEAAVPMAAAVAPSPAAHVALQRARVFANVSTCTNARARRSTMLRN